MTHKQNLQKHTYTHTHTHTHTHTKTQKQSREIHTWNSLDCRFDKDFYYGFQKHQMA